MFGDNLTIAPSMVCIPAIFYGIVVHTSNIHPPKRQAHFFAKIS